MFVSYTPIEVRIFEAVRRFFEKLPPLESDDYENAFYDLVTQYGPGSQEYMVFNIFYDDLINSTVVEIFNKLSDTEQKNAQNIYETHFLENYYCIGKDEYIYSSEDFIARIAERFKSWIEDNFSIEDLLSEDEEVEEDIEGDIEEDASDEEIQDGDYKEDENQDEVPFEIIFETRKNESSDRHDFQNTAKYLNFFKNLKINLKFIVAYFKYLAYEKRGKLSYLLGYNREDASIFHGVDGLLLDLDECITYQLSNIGEMDISGTIIFEQIILINDIEIKLFYHGQLWLHNLDYAAVIYWNSHWETPSFEMRLESPMSPETQLSLFENFHIVIADIIQLSLDDNG